MHALTRAAWWIGGGLLAVPALVQLALLAWAIAGRIAYPYDLEWMEGGLLVHADRLAQGLSLYPPPSVDFIPYPYTPGYPALLSVVGRIFGLSYPVGRAVGVVALVAILAIGAWALVRAREPRDRAPAALGAILAWGVIAATYPWLNGWLDLVRGDVVFLAIALVGFVWLDRALGASRAWPGVIGAATVLAGSFFFKQTGVLLVAAGGVLVAARRWRCVPAYVVTAGVVGGGGTWLLDRVTDGWFWIYVFGVHQQHFFARWRFLRSFPNILLHFPAVTMVVLLTLMLVIAARVGRGTWPHGTRAFATWAWLAAAGTLVGAFGWAVEWAHFNAYLPAMVFLAFAAGAAIPTVSGAVRALAPSRSSLADIAGGVAALSIAVNLGLADWRPSLFVPSAADRTAGDALVARLASVPGEVFVPSHPWYAVLAGKRPFVHRMSVMEMTSWQRDTRRRRLLPARAHEIAGLREALSAGRFDLVVLDDRWNEWEFPTLTTGYRLEGELADRDSPRVVSGRSTRPRRVYVPAARAPVAPPRGGPPVSPAGRVLPPG